MATGMPAQHPIHAETGVLIKFGALGGLIAGIVFALFEMIVAALMMGGGAFWMPLRMIGAIVLGQQAIEPTYNLAIAAIVGAIVHMVLSIVFGIIFGVIVALAPGLAESAGTLVVAASVYGFALWLINFYVLARIGGWSWFPGQTNVVEQFIAHTFFYGTVLGWMLERTVAPRRAA